MRNRMLRNRCVIGLIVVALIAGCFQLKTYWWEPATVRAQGDDDDDGLSGGALAVLLLAVGGAEAQVRLSVGSLAAVRTTPPYAWFFVVRNPRNEVLFRSERIEVPSGEWRFSEVPGALLGTVGEQGPAQVKVEVFLDIDRGEKASNYIGSAQVWTGATVESSTNFSFRLNSTITNTF